jgi:hypothetical protein
LGLALAALAVGLVLPDRLAPLYFTSAILLAAWMAYFLIRWLKSPLPDRSDRSVEVVWDSIVPGIGRSADAVRFLIRLCQRSIGNGRAAERAAELIQLVEHATVLARKGGPFVQLLAVARLLQVHDQSRQGRDRIGGLIAALEPVLRGELPLAYAEAASEFILTSDFITPGDQRRLGVTLLETAFGNGLTPSDLVTIGRFCPHLRRLLLDLRPNLLGLLYVIWRGRNTRAWESVGPATTVFEIARDEPVTARRILTDEPDTVLRVDLDEPTENTLGGIVITARGVSVGGFSVADPAAAADVVKASTGEWQLHFGPHKIALDTKIPLKLAGELEGWLKFRATRLVPEAGQLVRRGTGDRAVALLAPLAVDCPLCHTRSLVRTGRIGTPWQAVAGAGARSSDY